MGSVNHEIVGFGFQKSRGSVTFACLRKAVPRDGEVGLYLHRVFPAVPDRLQVIGGEVPSTRPLKDDAARTLQVRRERVFPQLAWKVTLREVSIVAPNRPQDDAMCLTKLPGL